MTQSNVNIPLHQRDRRVYLVMLILTVTAVPVFGLPRTSPDIATFGPSLGGRNMAAGAIVLVSSFHASRPLTGIFLAFIATGAGWSDTAVCLAKGKGHKRHLLNIGIIYTVATLLIVA